MRLWITRNGEVPVGEQIVRQVILGIVSQDLVVGQKLPSVRALARRHNIHQTRQAQHIELFARRVGSNSGAAAVFTSAEFLRRLNSPVSPHGLNKCSLKRENGDSIRNRSFADCGT